MRSPPAHDSGGSGAGPVLLVVGLLIALALAALLLPCIPCPECDAFGEVQYVHSVTGTKASCPRCKARTTVTILEWLPRLNPEFH
ncbi:MAG TPA: hypothetical protein VE981_04380 [Planctomycetota bacterium]|nr:hypothetical protein [Planctomycetota bacterium]